MSEQVAHAPWVRHRFANVNGLRHHIAELGGDGRPMLLLHGTTNQWASWLPSAEGLASLGRLMAVDFRGHGDSQWSPLQAYRTADLADDVEALVTGVDMHPVDLIGSSSGGLVALEVAARRPNLVRTVVLIDIPPSFSQSEHDVPPRPKSFPDHAAVVGWERGRNQFASDEAIEILASFGTRPGPGGLLQAKHDPFFLSRWPFRADDRWSQLAQIAQPTLVVRGMQSQMLPAAIAKRVIASLPFGTLAEIPSAGHLVHVDAPHAFTETVRQFFLNT